MRPLTFVLPQVIRAQGRATALTITARAEAERTAIIAEAEAARIRTIDAAMARVCPTTAQRELVTASGAVLGTTKTNVVLARNVGDVAALMGGGSGGLAASMMAGASS